MYIILWEYYVKSEKQSEFEDIYSSNGAWAELFKKGNGYVGTELIHSTEVVERYITVDRWVSLDSYETFLSRWMDEYKTLDRQSEGLTHHESYLGRFESG
ncbi:MAG TPA: antibiotic biosynthesis monooxygenase [Anaerolineales bacterium]|nr:antibiotic biosynthesis monooxygenase [Anaerolineales bacterium]